MQTESANWAVFISAESYEGVGPTEATLPVWEVLEDAGVALSTEEIADRAIARMGYDRHCESARKTRNQIKAVIRRLYASGCLIAHEVGYHRKWQLAVERPKWSPVFRVTF